MIFNLGCQSKFMIAKKSIKVVFVIGTLLVAVAILVAYQMYTKPHRSIEGEQGIVVTAAQLFSEFERDETQSNQKYLDKVVEVTGRVSEITENLEGRQVILLEANNPMFGVQCTMNMKQMNITAGSQVTIKGICKGYLSDVVVTEGTIKK